MTRVRKRRVRVLKIENISQVEAIESGRAAQVDVTDNFWGYIIAPGKQVRARAELGEGLATIGSILFGTIAFAQWLLPGSSADPILIPFKLAITAVFFVGAGLLYSMAKRGLVSETQVDLHEREIRLVRRNRSDESLTLASCRFDDVERIEVKRTPGAFMMSSLLVRTKYDETPMVLITAPETAIEPLMDRIVSDVAPEPARKPRKRLRFSDMRSKVDNSNKATLFSSSGS